MDVNQNDSSGVVRSGQVWMYVFIGFVDGLDVMFEDDFQVFDLNKQVNWVINEQNEKC